MPPKSGFSRTRNIDYDDDDAYDDEDEYYEEAEAEGGDGMTEDDKEQMRVGTIRVREALGETSGFLSDAQIQEALWHYFYDVGKSVTYLKNKLGTETKQETQKKEKAVSRFDQAATVADQNAPATTGKHNHIQSGCVEESAYPVASNLPLPPSSMPAADNNDFFWDTPWGNVPYHRQGVITVDAPLWRGGLLGGSSKLAALAAKRRKEREEAEAASAAAKSTADADAAIAMLDKLTVKSKDGTPSTLSVDGAQDAQRPARVSRYPVRRRSPSPQATAPTEAETLEPEEPQSAIIIECPAQRASASMFASTLCGPGKATTQTSPGMQAFPAPYALCKGYDSATPFEGPSPDDIVRAAQAKGAGGGRR
jgi:elongation factor 1 alpha-like protein